METPRSTQRLGGLDGPRPAMTTYDVVDGLDLAGHVSVITGASGGLGLETARALASRGACVVLASRDAAANHAAADRIRELTSRPDAADEVTLDLGSLASVRHAADQILERHPDLHSVIANAGVMAVPQGRTTDGFETHFGVNHLGHFVFVNRLMGGLVRGAPSRVVVLSSLGHRWSDVDLTNPNLDGVPYRKFHAYGASKTANALFAMALDDRYEQSGVRAFAVHPGGIETNLGRHLTDNDREKLHRGAAAKASSGSKSVEEGAATTVWAAVSPELEGLGGLYLEDCALAEVDPRNALGGVSAFAVDRERAAILWSLSEELVGERFPAAMYEIKMQSS